MGTIISITTILFALGSLGLLFSFILSKYKTNKELADDNNMTEKEIDNLYVKDETN